MIKLVKKVGTKYYNDTSENGELAFILIKDDTIKGDCFLNSELEDFKILNENEEKIILYFKKYVLLNRMKDKTAKMIKNILESKKYGLWLTGYLVERGLNLKLLEINKYLKEIKDLATNKSKISFLNILLSNIDSETDMTKYDKEIEEIFSNDKEEMFEVLIEANLNVLFNMYELRIIDLDLLIQVLSKKIIRMMIKKLVLKSLYKQRLLSKKIIYILKIL